jgi:DNA-directed RNA polymerase subunit E'/Rpb7
MLLAQRLVIFLLDPELQGTHGEPPTVTFRLVMFRPFRGETLIAKVKSSTEDAIRR